MQGQGGITMSEFKQLVACEKCGILAECVRLDVTACQRAERLEAVMLPVMPQGFKKRIMRVVDK